MIIKKISSYIEKIKDYLKTEQTYFSNLDILSITSKCGATFDDLRLKERDEFKKEIFEAINLLDDGTEYDDEFLDLKDGASLKLKPGTFTDALQLYNILYTPVGKDFVELLGHSGYVTSVVFSPDGKYIVSGSWDETVRVWDVTKEQEATQFSGHSGYVTSVVFSPNGKYIASGSSDKTIRIWDITSKQEIVNFSGHSGYVTSVVFSPNGKYIASASGDETVRVWDIESNKEIAKFSVYSDTVGSVAFSPNGKYIASASGSNIQLCIDKLENWKILKKQQEIKKIKEQKEREKRLKEQEAREKAKIEQEQKLKQQQNWRNNGQCEMCGAKLGFLDKMVGQDRCKGCRD